MARNDYDALLRLKDVGAEAILAEPGMAEYMKYCTSGNKNFTFKGETFYNARGDVHARTVGTCTASKSTKSPIKYVSEEAKAVMAMVGAPPEAATYALPPTGPDAVRESLKGQFLRQMPGDWKVLTEQPGFLAKINEFTEQYPTTVAPTDTPLCNFVDRFIANMDGTKSAGWSGRYKPGPKQVWANGPDRDLLVYMVSARLALRMAEASRLPYMAPWTMVTLGLMDPEELAPKMEGHDDGKVKSKRWRMIWVTSMLDAVVQSFTHRDQNKEDIYAYSGGALKCQGIGMGHNDSGIQLTGETLEWVAGDQPTVQCSDASGWDLSVTRDAIVYDAERRINRLSRECPLSWELIMAEAFCNSAHVVVVGRYLVCPTHFGITASGIPSTSAQNSPIRSLTLVASGADRAHSIGDDEVHSGDVDVVLLATTGVITKGDIQECPADGPIDLTSHDYYKQNGKWTARFKNLPKMLAHLDLKRAEGCPPLPDAIRGMRYCLRNSKDEDAILCAFVRGMGWDVVEPEELPWGE
jgi:hypothetical protein